MRKSIVKAALGAVILVLLVLSIIILRRPKETLKSSLTEDVASISLTQFDSHEAKETLTLADSKEIKEVMDLLEKAQKTRKSTVNDTPYVNSYYKAEIQGESKIRTFNIYQSGRYYYAEEPYSAIYRLSKKSYEDLVYIYTAGIAATPHYAFVNP